MKRFRSILLALCVLCAPKADAQRYLGDILLMDGDTLHMMDLPLNYNSELHEFIRENTENIFSYEKDLPVSGYMAVWEIRNDSLLLSKILQAKDSPVDEWEEMTLTDIFDKYRKNGRVQAIWFYGAVRCGKGRVLKSEWNRYHYFDEELDLTFARGTVTESSRHRHELRKAPLTQDEAIALARQHYNIGQYPGLADGNTSIRILPNSDGSIGKLEVSFAHVHRNHEEVYREEIRRCLEFVPAWDVLIRDGEILPVKFTVWWEE